MIGLGSWFFFWINSLSSDGSVRCQRIMDSRGSDKIHILIERTYFEWTVSRLLNRHFKWNILSHTVSIPAPCRLSYRKILVSKTTRPSNSRVQSCFFFRLFWRHREERNNSIPSIPQGLFMSLSASPLTFPLRFTKIHFSFMFRLSTMNKSQSWASVCMVLFKFYSWLSLFDIFYNC